MSRISARKCDLIVHFKKRNLINVNIITGKNVDVQFVHMLAVYNVTLSYTGR